EYRGVRYRSRHRAGRVLCVSDRDDTAPRDEAQCRLDPDDTVRNGGTDYRTVRLGADCGDGKISRHGNTRAGARPARVLVEKVRIVCFPAASRPTADRFCRTEVRPLA